MQEFITDWLASTPVFYNETNKRISHNINDVVDWGNVTFDPEGLSQYLAAGYSVFERTPILGVKMLPHSSSVRVDETTGKLLVRSDVDEVPSLVSGIADESEVIEKILASVQAWEKEQVGPLVVPTSGGFDSRLLNMAIRDKSRVRAFTYGLSATQRDSHEVVFAKELSRELGFAWSQIEIGAFHDYLSAWDRVFGVSTHAHGMYQMEFFEKVRQQEPDLNGSAFLSGIIGDAWAGSLSIADINSPQDLKYLYYSHGLNADSNVSLLPVKNHELLEQHFERERQYLKNDKYRIVAAMRCKLTLLCYLMRVPEHLGFRPWSPFLNQEIALDMLNISEGRKRKRQWQRDFFAKQGCDLEAKKLSVSNKNELNYLGMNIRPLQPLSIDLLREIIDSKYVEWINAQIGRETSLSRLKRWGLRTRNIRRIVRACGVKNDRLQAYAAYLTLKPLENVISRRNEHYSAK